MSATLPPLQIGLILSGHVSSCPRAVKFADALHAHGYAVRVFAPQHTSWVSELDRQLLAHRAWRATLVARPRGGWRRLAAVEQRIAQAMWGAGIRSGGVARWVEARNVRALLAAAVGYRPQVWIGFNVPGMIVAARLADRNRGALVVDIEDDHVGILPASARSERSRLACILEPLLRQAHQRITTSVEMGALLNARYGIDCRILHNVPTLDGVSPLPIHQRRRSLLWTSQTVGPDRGLEEFLPILARLPIDVHLTLLGRVSERFRCALLGRAHDLGIMADRIRFLAPVDPARMLAASRENLLGLALENTRTENRRVCLTNKMFDYLAAGLPVVCTRTPAQERLASELGEAACVIDIEQPEQSVERIRRLLDDDVRYEKAADAAWQASIGRYNWQLEQLDLISMISPLLRQA